MTPRSFFKILIKVLALFFIWQFIGSIPQLIYSIASLWTGENSGTAIVEIVFTVFFLLFYCVVIFQLLFNTERILDKLKLDKGFTEEQFTFNLSSFQLYTITIIVIGTILLIQEIPTLFRSVAYYLEIKKLAGTYTASQPSFAPIVMSLAKIIVALLLIGERKRIVSFIEDRQKQKTEEAEEE